MRCMGHRRAYKGAQHRLTVDTATQLRGRQIAKAKEQYLRSPQTRLDWVTYVAKVNKIRKETQLVKHAHASLPA
jgi:hypothetical protein